MASLFEGSCLCGNVNIRIASAAKPTHDPAICHCNHCRAFHSAPFALEAGWAHSNVTMEGDTFFYKSSKHFERHRCSICGSPCAGIHKKLGAIFVPSTLLVPAGNDIEKIPMLSPRMHLFYKRRIVGSLFERDGLPKYDEFPPPWLLTKSYSATSLPQRNARHAPKRDTSKCSIWNNIDGIRIWYHPLSCEGSSRLHSDAGAFGSIIFMICYLDDRPDFQRFGRRSKNMMRQDRLEGTQVQRISHRRIVITARVTTNASTFSPSSKSKLIRHRLRLKN